MASLDHGVPLDHFLRAAALLSSEIDNVDFAILGTGPRLQELQHLAHELHLSGSAVFLGERHDALDILSTGNVMAVVTDDAWSAAAALQALARGLRVVPNDVPGLRELFEGVSSIRPVAVADHAAFSRALAEQLDEMTMGEDELEVSTGMAWGLSELMASQDEFDLDRPGLDPRDRRRHVNAEIQALLDRYSVPRMVEETVTLYREVTGTAAPRLSLSPE
jgi:glycosyltransferase involved in cell wall biosynthesis